MSFGNKDGEYFIDHENLDSWVYPNAFNDSITIDLTEKNPSGKADWLFLGTKDNDEVIGIIHQVSGMGKYVKTVEIGYALKKKYWNKGYMSEALKLMIKLMFERGVHKISCGAIKENKASIEVMKKCGMLYEGTDIDDIYYHDQYWDTDYYYILEDMFHVEHNKEND